MSLFSKVTYSEQNLPFIVDDFTVTEPDSERAIVDIEAYGIVGDKMVYCYASYGMKRQYMYDNGDFEALLNLLRQSDGKKVTVKFKFKSDKVKSFKLSTESLAKIYNDDRFLQLDLTGWGLNDVSCKNRYDY